MQETVNSEAAERSTRNSSGWKKNVVGIVVSIVCIAFITSRINLDELLTALANFEWEWLLFGVAFLLLDYTFRIVRWFLLLRAGGAHVPLLKCAAPFLGSIALNNVLPMRLGDVVRAMVFPLAIGVGRIPATASLVMERLVDLLTLLAALALGLLMTSGAELPEWLPHTAIVLATVGGISLIGLFLFSGPLANWVGHKMPVASSSKGGRIARAVRDMLVGFEGMSRLPVLVALFGLSMLVWAGEAGLFWSLLRGFGLEATIGAAAVVMAIATLSTLVPSSPGYIGPFHLAAYAAIAMLGGSPAQAASFAILAHLGVWLPTTVLGAIAILLNPHLFRRAKTLAVTNSVVAP